MTCVQQTVYPRRCCLLRLGLPLQIMSHPNSSWFWVDTDLIHCLESPSSTLTESMLHSVAQVQSSMRWTSWLWGWVTTGNINMYVYVHIYKFISYHWISINKKNYYFITHLGAGMYRFPARKRAISKILDWHCTRIEMRIIKAWNKNIQKSGYPCNLECFWNLFWE